MKKPPSTSKPGMSQAVIQNARLSRAGGRATTSAWRHRAPRTASADAGSPHRRGSSRPGCRSRPRPRLTLVGDAGPHPPGEPRSVRSTGRSRVRDWARDGSASARRVQARAAALVARIPVLGRLVSELVRVEVIDRALAIGAQALLAVLPSSSSWLPSPHRPWGRRAGPDPGRHGDPGRPGRTDPGACAARGPVREEVGWIGLLITLISGTASRGRCSGLTRRSGT